MLLMSLTVELILALVLLLLAGTVAMIAYTPVGLWVTANTSGVKVSLFRMVLMKLRNVSPSAVLTELIKARKAGLSFLSIDQLEGHFQAGGNISQVVDALIQAYNGKLELSFDEAKKLDLAGRNVLRAVQDSVNTRVIESPRIEAMAKDGIQLFVVVRITVKGKIINVIGKAGDETIIARIGQAIVGSIGSNSHIDIVGKPELISEYLNRDGKGLNSFAEDTAFDIISVDIADIDVGENIGARLAAQQAESDMKVAQAEAEQKRAASLADEQFYRAEVQKMRAKLIEAESQLPQALSDALRSNNFGALDYYRLQNLQADTRMRRGLASEEAEDMPLPPTES